MSRCEAKVYRYSCDICGAQSVPIIADNYIPWKWSVEIFAYSTHHYCVECTKKREKEVGE